MRDYAGLLHLAEGYTVMRMHIDPEDWTAGRSLGDLRLRDEGVAVLGIERLEGSYVGDPTEASRLRVGDTAIVYGRQHELEQLARRPTGEVGQRIHESAVAVHADRVATRRGDRLVSALG